MDANKKTLIDGLNEDLANEYTAMIMYNHYAATVGGLAGQVLKPFFLGEVEDEIGLKIELEDLIADETKHKIEIERMLRDPLFR